MGTRLIRPNEAVLTSTHNLHFEQNYRNQKTNGPVNAHLISGPTISTKTSFAKFDIIKSNPGHHFIQTL